MASAKRLRRIHLLQQWYDLSDPAMEDALIEVATIRRFAGIALITDRIPDETTILAFRHLLEQNELGEQIFEVVKAHLKANAAPIRKGDQIGVGVEINGGSRGLGHHEWAGLWSNRASADGAKGGRDRLSGGPGHRA